MALVCGLGQLAVAQNPAEQRAPAGTTEQKIRQLTLAVSQAQAEMSAYEKRLQDMERQLSELQQQLAAERGAQSAAASSSGLTAASAATPLDSLNEIRERQAVEESQIAVHDQTKVESDSKYPLKISGLLLFNGFVNTRQVDVAPNPTYAVPGSGSTGFSLRQTVLGLDARGPHLFDASSHADVRVDFFAGALSGYSAGGVLRLRTAHAALDWRKTEVFVELDRPLLSPNLPTSLVATAQPEFAWSGNLWTWNPQAGIAQQLPLTRSTRLSLQAALIDVSNPVFPASSSTSPLVSQTERSRWPGGEARIAFASGNPGAGPEIGVGGYFSPHETGDNARYNAWAGSLDLRLPLTRHFEMTASAYRGQALGGLGGGGYVDYVYQTIGSTEVTRPLDDVGGWTQLKSRWGQRLEFNGGYGIDNPFAGEIRASLGSQPYFGLARNSSAFVNTIYSPSAYLLFSLEYRRLWTNYITGPTEASDAIGIGAGYRF